ncbi:restriction endonuclease subunit S [Aeromonas jandaei]|uniref:restriction endonuclease subunit S n=1 Tax=Aeromonas jandaei TaxID=650 RepID=UPI0038B5E15B
MKTGWETVRLGELCKTSSGGTPLKSKKEYYEGGTIPWLLSGEVAQGEIIQATNFITQKGLENSSAKLFPPNTVLVAMYGATAGQVGVLRIEASTNQAVCGIFPNEYFVPEFLFYLLLSRKDELIAKAAGNAQPNISQQKIRDTLVPIVPLPDQQRIVDILDEAFETIATARANAEQNRQNSRALFESYLQSVFSLRGDGWTEKPLGEMATFRNGVNFTKSSQGEPIKILGVKDFQDYYWAPLNSLDSIIPDGTLPDTDTLQQNDIIFVRSNGNPELIGRCLLIGEVQERTTFSGFTIRARRFTDEVLPQYLCHFLKSSHIRRELVDGGNGANIRSLNQGALSKLRINFPVALSEQERIVEQLETMQSETQHLESLYQRKIAALDELKQSLLQQAFSGQL